MMRLKRLPALILSGALLALSPGAGFYEAAAAGGFTGGRFEGHKAEIEGRKAGPERQDLGLHAAPGLEGVGVSGSIHVSPLEIHPEVLPEAAERDVLSASITEQQASAVGALGRAPESVPKAVSRVESGETVRALGRPDEIAHVLDGSVKVRGDVAAAEEPVAEAGAGGPVRREATLGSGVGVSFVIESILEDIPSRRTKAVELIEDASIHVSAKRLFWSEFKDRLKAVAGSEGVPRSVISLARRFLRDLSESSGAPLDIRREAEALKGSIGEGDPGLKEKALKAGFHEDQLGLVRAVVLRHPGLAESPQDMERLFKAASGLQARGIFPTSGLALAVMRQGDEREKTLKALAELMRGLEGREPAPFDEVETDLFYSVLSRRIDLRDAGYYSYRRRVEAAREYLKASGFPSARWLDDKGFKPFDITHAYHPYDVSQVDLRVLKSHRDFVFEAYRETMSLKALDREDLGPVRAEILRRTWAYFKLWPQVEKRRSGLKDAEGKPLAPVPLTSKEIRAYLGDNPPPSEEAMRSDLEDGGKTLFVSLHVALSQLLDVSKEWKDERHQAVPAIRDLLYRNMIGFQGTDEVARQELGHESLGDDTNAWEAGKVYHVLNRMLWIYVDKSQEFQAWETGRFVQNEIKKRLEESRRAIREQLAKVIRSERSNEETIRFVPAYGVSSLFRGFCGPDCSKSLSPARGFLALRAMDPNSAFYYGMVDGKAVGYFQLVEALRGKRKVLLVEILQFAGRASLVTPLLTRLNDEAARMGYEGVAVPSSLHPWDDVAKEHIANFSNFDDTITYIKAWKPYQEGTPFKPAFPFAAEMAAMERDLGRVRYFSWGLGDGTYKLLKFDPGQAAPEEAPGSGPDRAAHADGTRAVFDPKEGIEDIRRLETINEDIARSLGGISLLKEQGLVREGSKTVYRNAGAGQIMPFEELLLPMARTGLLVPTKRAGLDQYDGLAIFAPGIGAVVSTALSVMDVALSLSNTKDKKYPALDDFDGTGRKLRLLSFPLDLTLNGMGSGMPFAFGSAEGMTAVLRHAVLILKSLYPGMPVFLAGRSQGGMAVLEYAARHDDVAGVAALNPSHPDPEIVRASIPVHENGAVAVMDGMRIALHPRSWKAYKVFTSQFGFIGELSKVPALLLLGKNDPSYPQPLYLDSYRRFVEAQPGMRRLAVFDAEPGKSHNLWNRSEPELYARVLSELARFFSSVLRSRPRGGA